MIKRSKGRLIFQIINYSILAMVILATLLPILHVIASSVSDHSYISRGQVSIFPRGINFEAYKRVLKNSAIWKSYLNTIIYTCLYIVISLLITSTGAFVLSREKFVGKKFLIGFIIFPLMFNGGLVPTFLVVKGIGLYNSMWSIILSYAVFSYYLIIMKTFFEQIPYELEEAATIDGCSRIQVLYKIIMPLAFPAMITIGLFYAVYQWNSFLYPLIFLQDKDKFPIQLVLRDIVLQNQTDDMLENVSQNLDVVSESIKYAVIVVASLPIIAVYPFVQKYFIKGMIIGAVKG